MDLNSILKPKSREDIMRDLSALSKDELDKQLIRASEHGLTNIVQWIIDAGANVNAKNNIGGTPLMIASQYGHEVCVKLLLDVGADVNAKNKDGWTALMFASRYGHKDVVELLKKHGATK